MNSCLYEIEVMHHRFKPKEHKLRYKVFMFYLDLDEISILPKKNRLFGYNSPSIYSFYDKDHLELGGQNVKGNILRYLKSKGVDLPAGKIRLLTNVRTFGYVFNPVSFYFCFDASGKPVYVVPEIGNTFGELKPFFIGADKIKNGRFCDTQAKHFYISPYTELEDQLEFRLSVPDDELNICIDTKSGDDKILVASMIGHRKEFNFRTLLGYTFRFPLMTLKVIFLIHWHAALLFLKGLPPHKKEANPQLQREVYRGWTKNKNRFFRLRKTQAQ